MKFSELLAAAKEKYNVIIENKNYFTVENSEGYRAYFQLDVFGYKYDDPNYYYQCSFSTEHKPNKKTGSGYQTFVCSPIKDVNKLYELLEKTLEQSKENIVSGKEKMDTRKPAENRKYLI